MASEHVRYQTDGSCTLSTTTVSSNYDNHLGGAFTYDGSGDLTYDGTNTLTYDAEGRIATSTASGSTTTYIYGADGQRIGKTQGGVQTNYARGIDGSLLATYVGGTFNGYPHEMWVGGCPVKSNNNRGSVPKFFDPQSTKNELCPIQLTA